MIEDLGGGLRTQSPLLDNGLASAYPPNRVCLDWAGTKEATAGFETSFFGLKRITFAGINRPEVFRAKESSKTQGGLSQ
jgi:hypothetical protein